MSSVQIENKLSECYKKHQPVLLYNDTSGKRNNIILDTHTKNGGKLNDVHNKPVKGFEEVLSDYYYDEKEK